jgi:hypothetical protein
MDVLRAQTARRSLIAGRVSLALYKKGPTLSRVCGSPRGRAEVIASVRVRQRRNEIMPSMCIERHETMLGRITLEMRL